MKLADSVGVIGGGVVGRAVARGFLEHVGEVRIYDKDPLRGTHGLRHAVESDVTFLALPTPFDPVLGLSESVIEEFLSSIAGHDGRLVIKSTLMPGVTERLACQYELPGLVHSAEFLTARAAHTDFQSPSRNIVGYTTANSKEGEDNASNWLVDFYKKRFPGVPVFRLPAAGSELIKMACNAFFSSKVIFFNQVHQLCGALGLRYEEVLQGMLTDGRLGSSHTSIPGPDGRFGSGGACFTKDHPAFAVLQKALGLDASVTEATTKYNRSIRGKE